MALSIPHHHRPDLGHDDFWSRVDRRHDAFPPRVCRQERSIHVLGAHGGADQRALLGPEGRRPGTRGAQGTRAACVRGREFPPRPERLVARRHIAAQSAVDHHRRPRGGVERGHRVRVLVLDRAVLQLQRVLPVSVVRDAGADPARGLVHRECAHHGGQHDDTEVVVCAGEWGWKAQCREARQG